MLVADDPQALAWVEQAWTHVTTRMGADVISLRRLRDDEPVTPLATAMPGCWTEASAAPAIDFRRFESFQAYHDGLSKSFRKGLKERRRRLERGGPARFELVADREQAERLLSVMNDWKEARLSVRNDNADRRHDHTLTDEFHEFRELFDATVIAEFEAGRMHMSHLVQDGRTIAVLTALRMGNQFDGWHFAFDPAFAHCAPGRLILFDFLQWAHGQGAAVVDFMPGPDPYKLDWATHQVRVRNCRAALSLRGRLYMAWVNGGARRAAVGLYLYLPVGMQRFIRKLLS